MVYFRIAITLAHETNEIANLLPLAIRITDVVAGKVTQSEAYCRTLLFILYAPTLVPASSVHSTFVLQQIVAS